MSREGSCQRWSNSNYLLNQCVLILCWTGVVAIKTAALTKAAAECVANYRI